MSSLYKNSCLRILKRLFRRDNSPTLKKISYWTKHTHFSSTLFDLILISLTLSYLQFFIFNPAQSFAQHKDEPLEGSVNLLEPAVAQSLSSLQKRLITVKNDPLYGGEQRYEGYDFKELVDWLAKQTGVSLNDSIISFIATDGYLSQIPTKDIPIRLGALAFRELGGNETKPFRDSVTSRVPFNPAPFYLVWDGVFSGVSHPPTPWGVVTIKLSRNQIPDVHLPPTKDPTLLKGMELWRTYCSKCHSINKVGGTMGPELNVPKNITEYWDRNHLLELIKNPASLRWGSKMPSFNWLSEGDRESIVAYIEVMKGKKVCTTENECS